MDAPRHAYLILAHNHPEQLRILLSLLDDGRNDVFVHLDAHAPFGPEALEGSCRRSALHFIEPRFEIHWGGVSIMRAELALLRAAVGGGYAYYHLLSGQDLPIKSQDTIHAWFREHDGELFLQYWRPKFHYVFRTRYYALFPEGAGQFWPKIANGIFKGLQLITGRRINRGIDFRYASQWFSIPHDCAMYVLSQEAWLERVFAHTCLIDETFLATLVWNSPFRERLYDPTEHASTSDIRNMAHLRFIDWTRGGLLHRHPWVFRESDGPLLDSVPHFWARKFDISQDAAIIHHIADNLKTDTSA